MSNFINIVLILPIGESASIRKDVIPLESGLGHASSENGSKILAISFYQDLENEVNDLPRVDRVAASASRMINAMNSDQIIF